MSNFPNPQKLALALSVMERLHLPKKTTIGELDLAESSDLQELMGPIEDQIQGRFYQTIELIDDEPYQDKIKLVFSVKTPALNGRRDSDEDGPYWDSEMVTERITLIVKPETAILRIVAELESEVRGIEYNVFA